MNATASLKSAIKRVLPYSAVRFLRNTRRTLFPTVSQAGMDGEPFRFSEDGLSTIHNCDFLDDPAFQRAYAAGESTGSWKGRRIRWRASVVCWSALYASALPGDFVECGVNRGGNCAMILSYLGAGDFGRSFFLFDTFSGFVDAYLSSAERQTVGRFYSYSECLDDVTTRFAPHPFVKLVPGPVPDTLSKAPVDRVSFLSLDMNCAGPEIAAAEHFWPRMVPGGVIVLDDYGFTAHGEQRRGFNDFASRAGVPLLPLPTGQGVIFKPPA